jgi:hypothetical protein
MHNHLTRFWQMLYDLVFCNQFILEGPRVAGHGLEQKSPRHREAAVYV